VTLATFPQDFVWGTATASYQVEGAVREDGRGASIWDTFSAIPGNVKNGNTGEVACDHYHRWREDIELMRQLNISAYRFSIAWSRIFPEGRGQVNQKGIDFYSRLVDGLLAARITPFVTLYHWDLPQTLEDEDGWLRRGISEDFTNYADVVSRAIGDRVKHWITFNEPWVFTWLGYVKGEHAPGQRSDTPRPALLATHHTYLAHGAAVPVIRRNSPDSKVGITLNLVPADAASPKGEDAEAAARFDGYFNRWYLDPLFRGHYPADMVELFEPYLPDIRQGDMQQIQAPLDFLGINYYTREVVAQGARNPLIGTDKVSPEGEYTTTNAEVYPEGLYNTLKRVHSEYSPKAIYITENGASFDDELTSDGQVHDERRANYLKVHFEAAARALEEGVPLKGYFVWSMMDNFEWALGYSIRFGVYYVDYTTQRRILKDSGRYFAQVAKTGQT
jgi:beta-glucosidase